MCIHSVPSKICRVLSTVGSTGSRRIGRLVPSPLSLNISFWWRHTIGIAKEENDLQYHYPSWSCCCCWHQFWCPKTFSTGPLTISVGLTDLEKGRGLGTRLAAQHSRQTEHIHPVPGNRKVSSINKTLIFSSFNFWWNHYNTHNTNRNMKRFVYCRYW